MSTPLQAIRSVRRGARMRVLLLAALLCASAPDAKAGAAHGTNSAGFVVVPFIVYAPETGAAFTMVSLCHFRSAVTDLPPSVVSLALAYSEREQSSIRLEPDLYLGEDVLLSAEVAFEDWPDVFHGIGNETDEDDLEDYSSENWIARLAAEHRIGSAWWLGAAGEYQSFDLTEVEPGGLLDTAGIAGSEGCTVTGIGLAARRDTRDDIFYPTRGSYLYVSYLAYVSTLGGDYDFDRYRVDARHFRGFGRAGVLALRAYVQSICGEAPFQKLSFLGDIGEQNLMRGYVRGRYRDDHVAVAQAEWRVPLWWRVGLAVFAGAGDVMEEWRDLSVADLKACAGLGFRFRASSKEKVNLRFDLAFGEETPAAYFRIYEVF